MRIIIAESSFFKQIRQVENIGPEVSDEELSVRSTMYIRRLINHVRNFGVEVFSNCDIKGKLATLTAQLQPSWDEDSVATRLQGLSWLVPVAVTLDVQDVPAFCYEPMMRAAIQDQFGVFEPQLQRLTVAEIRPALENCARQILSAPVTPPQNEYEAEVQDMLYEQFLLDSGKTDQLRKEQRRREIDGARRAEEAAVAAANEARYEQFRTGGE